jgi:PAS domain S-box-containing protein
MQSSIADQKKINVPEFISGGGELGQRIREYDWASTPLGPVDTWPQSLRTCIRIMLTSRQPIWIGWGKELIKFYNDPYKAIVGGKHPWALGRPASVVWKDIWTDIEPLLKKVMEDDEGTYVESQLLIMERNGYPEETYYTFSYTPISGDDGRTAGMFCANTDDTDRIISERQLKTLTQLGKALTDCQTSEEVTERTINTLQDNPYDFPFALYRTFVDKKTVFSRSTPLGDATHLFQKEIDLNANNPISDTVRNAFTTLQPQVLDNVVNKVGRLPQGAWGVPPDKVMVLPIVQSGTKNPYGILVVGINPYRLLDEKYMAFFSLIADQVATSFANVHVLEEERKRAEALAEIDRAKTTFFSNISHEFRTPLTLLLGPVEDAFNDPNTIPENKIRMDVAYRNALRMQRLVNTLLDFSRIEAGRMEGQFTKVDICSFTKDLASSFRSAVEKAGMQLEIHCGEIKGDVYVDTDMWEKIVLNLISNAFKYSKEGKITVTVFEKNETVHLSVKDTGVGIPQDQVDKIFDRFHRVENIQGRSGEGTGIGLAMVKELVKLHGGNISVESQEGVGSTFTVGIPTGKEHLPHNKVVEETSNTVVSKTVDSYLQEALKWIPEKGNGQVSATEQNTAASSRPVVLLADDNADMRDYVNRLLSDDFTVITATDGEDAYNKLLLHKPDLLLTDVMMPKLDGFGLLKKVRKHTELSNTPVIFLSARAGEEAKVEGLEAGADDYLVKPFSARELLAKVTSHIKVNRYRNKALQDIYNMFDEVPFAVAVLMGPTLTIEFINKYNLNIWRRNKEEVLGKPLFEVFPGNKAGAEPIHRHIYQTGERFVAKEVPIELWVNEQPEVHYFNAIVDPLRDETGEIIGQVATSIDVTDFVIARKQIEERETYFRQLADTAPAILWITEKDGSCSYLSKDWYETTGQSKQEALGFGWLKATHPEDIEESSRIFLNANEKHIPFHILYRLRHKDETYRWSIDRGSPRFDKDGNFEGFIGVVIDVHEQRLAEIALDESENRQKLAVESAGMGTWACDLDTGLVYCSERTREVFGYTDDPTPLTEVFNTIHPDDSAMVQQAVNNAALHPDGTYYAEYRVINGIDGSERYVIANGKMFFDEARKPVKFIGTCLDVTKQKEIEETIRKSEERYRHIFEGTPISIWEEDFSFVRAEVLKLKSSGKSDLKKYFADNSQHLIQLIQSVGVNDVNEATLNLLEADSKDEIKKGLQQIFIEDTSEAFIRELEIIAQGGGRFEFETCLQTLKGKRIDVLVHIDFPKDDNYSSVLVTLVDITERRMAERALKESEAEFRELANAMPQLVWVAESDGKVIYYNDRLSEFAGATKTEEGKWIWEGMVHGEDIAVTNAAWKKSVKEGTTYQVEHRVKLKDGTYKWFLSRANPQKDENGRIIKWFGTATDVHSAKEYSTILENEVKNRTQELQKLNISLQQSNHDLQQFAHVASHDLKEPLRKIRTFTGRLAEDPDSRFSEKAETYIDKVNTASSRMFTMIEGVLNYSTLNINQQNTEKINLNELFYNIQSDLELLIQQKSATIVNDHLPQIEGATVLIHQMFYNLLNNSLKFSKENEPLRITISSSIINQQGKDYARIVVKDNGIGFEQEYAEKIFDTFTRLNSKDLYEGTGLGLSLCKRIAERHGGSITANGQTGKGAEFIILLPLTQQQLTV